jgi:hypothetical protein
MSASEVAHTEAHEHSAHPPAEEDIVPSAKIVWVGVIALVVFFIGSVVAGFGMLATQRAANPDGPAPLPANAGQEKIGIVEQRLFGYANQGIVWQERAQKRLGSTGWVDRDRGIVHIPIDRAMEMVEKGARP